MGGNPKISKNLFQVYCKRMVLDRIGIFKCCFWQEGKIENGEGGKPNEDAIHSKQGRIGWFNLLILQAKPGASLCQKGNTH